MGFIYGIKSQYSGKCAQNLAYRLDLAYCLVLAYLAAQFRIILAYRLVFAFVPGWSLKS